MRYFSRVKIILTVLLSKSPAAVLVTISLILIGSLLIFRMATEKIQASETRLDWRMQAEQATTELGIVMYCAECSGFEPVIDRFTIQYPYQMQINQSAVVRIRSVSSTQVPGFDSVSIVLSGPNFDVKPSEQQTVNKESGEEFDMRWIVQPKNTGSHILILNLTDLAKLDHYKGNQVKTYLKDSQSSKIVLNSANALRELPVTVLSVWGIPQIWVSTIEKVTAVIAFLLALPFLNRFIESWKSKNVRIDLTRTKKRALKKSK